jgi:hypothetical protein
MALLWLAANSAVLDCCDGDRHVFADQAPAYARRFHPENLSNFIDLRLVLGLWLHNIESMGAALVIAHME